MTEPSLIPGGLAVDDRGEIRFVNDFSFEGIRRFYLISSHRVGFIRAWHGHRREEKYMLAVSGATLVGAVAIDDWECPAKDASVHRFVLAATKPEILYIPGGYANGTMTLTPAARLMVFSTATLDESLRDVVHFDSRYWNPWDIAER